ncbi:MAG: response regulator [Anaerolineae bacterium]|nr:response regulator [Anaerolineae bacterium]
MNIHVLIVDDSEAIIDILTDILTRQGYQVESRVDGEQGWGRLVEALDGLAPMPDLMLLDLMMPRVDGLTLLRRIRADERLALLPVIVLTVRAESSVRLEALRLGANDYLAKPFETAELTARVKTLLGWKLAERVQQQRMEHLVEAGRVLLSTIDLAHILRRVMQIVTEGVEAEGSSIWLRNPDDSLECRAASGRYGQKLLGVRMPSGEGIAGWVLQNRRPALVANVQSDPRFYREIDTRVGGRTRDLIAVPLIVHRIGVGIVEVINKRDETFSAADMAWLEVLAPLAAGAIANARLFETLQQRTEELQSRNAELDAFAHTVAHDLRNPLAVIMGYAEALAEDHTSVPDQELKGYLDTIARMSRRMDNIVEELLFLSQVRKTDVKMAPLDMGKIVRQALEQLSHLIEEYDAEVVSRDDWPVAMGYAPWVVEVWANYISNAIKYGGRPPYVELNASIDKDGRICFWVRDNGEGISEKDQGKLFVPFPQINQESSHSYGLGLSIVHRIVDKLGGKVGVSSGIGQGSVFSFTLPAAPEEGLSVDQGVLE